MIKHRHEHHRCFWWKAGVRICNYTMSHFKWATCFQYWHILKNKNPICLTFRQKISFKDKRCHKVYTKDVLPLSFIFLKCAQIRMLVFYSPLKVPLTLKHQADIFTCLFSRADHCHLFVNWIIIKICPRELPFFSIGIRSWGNENSTGALLV